MAGFAEMARSLRCGEALRGVLVCFDVEAERLDRAVDAEGGDCLRTAGAVRRSDRSGTLRRLISPYRS